MCNEAVKVMRQYVTVTNVELQASCKSSQPMEQEPALECLSGEVTQQRHAQVRPHQTERTSTLGHIFIVPGSRQDRKLMQHNS